MKCGSLLSGFAVGAMLFVPVAASAQPVRQIDARQVAAMCPVPALSGITLGSPRVQQDRDVIDSLQSLNKLPLTFAPFTEADLEITPWSQRLAGVTYLAESSDGPTNKAWSEVLERSLLESGWLVSGHGVLVSPLTASARIFEKQMETPLGKRTILLEFDTPGALILSCGDAELLDIQKDERDGLLEPGSPRPLKPENLDSVPMATEVDCENPMLLDALSEPGLIDETNPAMRAFIAGGEILSEQRLYDERLVTWLKWKLISSGKINEEGLWQIQDKVAPQDEEAMLPMMMDVLGAAAETAKAQEQGDPAAMCKSLVRVIGVSATKDRVDIAYHGKVAKALEQEAYRLGVGLD